MKKITKILSLVLVFAMLTLAFASCGTTAEDKVAAAMAKMASAKKTDCTAIINVEMDMGGMKIEMPMNMVMKTDTTDATKPVVYAEVSMTLMGETVKTTSFYKDGYLYTEASGQKVKMAMSYEEMMEGSDTGIDTAKIFEAKKDSIDESFVITENDDGSITVKMTVTKAEFASDLADFSEELAESLGDNGGVEISDTVFEFTVDKDCNVSALKATMNIDMTIQGQKVAVAYEMDFTYRPAGEDFEITLPTDLGSYKEVK